MLPTYRERERQRHTERGSLRSCDVKKKALAFEAMSEQMDKEKGQKKGGGARGWEGKGKGKGRGGGGAGGMNTLTVHCKALQRNANGHTDFIDLESDHNSFDFAPLNRCHPEQVEQTETAGTR